MAKKRLEAPGGGPGSQQDLKAFTPTRIERGTYTLAEAAERLGLSIRATRKAARTGQIAAVQIGRRWLVFISDLEALLAGGRPTEGDM